MWWLGSRVSGFQSFRVLALQGVRASGFRVSGLQRLEFCQGIRVFQDLGFRVFQAFRGFRLLGLFGVFGFGVSGFLGFRVQVFRGFVQGFGVQG